MSNLIQAAIILPALIIFKNSNGENSDNKVDLLNFVDFLNHGQEDNHRHSGNQDIANSKTELNLEIIMALLQKNYDARVHHDEVDHNPDVTLHVISNPEEIQNYRVHLKEKGVKLDMTEESDAGMTLKDLLQSLRRNAVFRLGNKSKESKFRERSPLMSGSRIMDSTETIETKKYTKPYSDDDKVNSHKILKKNKKKVLREYSSETKIKKSKKIKQDDVKKDTRFAEKPDESKISEEVTPSKAKKNTRKEEAKRFIVKKNDEFKNRPQENKYQKPKKMKKFERKHVDPKRAYFKPKDNLNYDRPRARIGDVVNVRTSIPFIGKRGIYDDGH